MLLGVDKKKNSNVSNRNIWMEKKLTSPEMLWSLLWGSTFFFYICTTIARCSLRKTRFIHQLGRVITFEFCKKKIFDLICCCIILTVVFFKSNWTLMRFSFFKTYIIFAQETQIYQRRLTYVLHLHIITCTTHFYNGAKTLLCKLLLNRQANAMLQKFL